MMGSSAWTRGTSGSAAGHRQVTGRWRPILGRHERISAGEQCCHYHYAIILSWLVAIKGNGATIRPPFGSFAKTVRACSISAMLRTGAAITVTSNEVETA